MTSSARTSPASGRRDTLLTATLLAVVTLVVYWPVLNAEFLNFDDPDFVTNNLHVQAGINGGSIAWAFSSLFIYWQPLTWLSYMLDFQLFGLNPRAFHATNLLLHVASTVLLFLVCRRMTRAHWASAVVAALFALHPLHVETVAWISERKGALSSLFWMLAMGAYVIYAERPGLKRYLPVLIFFACGLMSKSMVITLPCVLMLLDVWPLRRLRFGTAHPDSLSGPEPACPPRSLRVLILEKLPLFGLCLVSALLTFKAQTQLASVWSLERLPYWVRLAHSLVSYLTYIRKTFWPTDLAVFYPHPEGWPAWLGGMALVLLVSATGLCLWQARRQPWLIVGWLWFLGTFVPVIGLFQTGDQAWADRYSYLPLVGLFLMLVFGGRELLRRLKLSPRAIAGVALVLLAACSFGSARQVRFWLGTRALFEHTYAVTRRNHIAAGELGTIYAQAGQHEQAREFFLRSLEYRPDFFDGHAAFGNALLQARNFSEATAHFERALAYNPRHYEAWNGLGAALVQQGRPQEGLDKFDRALEIKPDFIDAQLNRALTLQSLGRIPEAISSYEEALRLRPNAPRVLFSVGNLLLSQRRIAEALSYLQQVLRVNPDHIDALNRVAWILSTHPDARVRNGSEALRLATRANTLKGGKDAATLNTLAAAYAETGQFPEAMRAAQEALQLATASGPPELAAIIQKLLDLYKNRTPYRDE